MLTSLQHLMKLILSTTLLTLLPLLLSSCGGPLSLVPYVMSAGFALKAGSEEYQYERQKRYKDKCLPIDEKKDAFASGADAEAKAELIAAYEYYQVAAWLGDKRALPRLEAVSMQMKPEDKKKAESNVKEFTSQNIESCYIRPIF